MRNDADSVEMMMAEGGKVELPTEGWDVARQGLGCNIVGTTIFTHTYKKWLQRAFKHAGLFHYAGGGFVLWALVVIITLMDFRIAGQKSDSRTHTYIFCGCLVRKYLCGRVVGGEVGENLFFILRVL